MSEEIEETTSSEGGTVNTAKSNKPALVIAGLVIAVLGFGGIGYWYFRSSGEGQPLPAPRTVTFGDNTNQPSGEPSSDQTITISEDQVAKIGLKTEIVGETLSSEAVSISSTGVVAADAYKETPVISLVGGVLRKVNGELGQSVGKGQTIGVIFSDEIASTQSKFLALQTEAQAARQNYERTAQLVRINPVSNAELDTAMKDLKTANAELIEHHAHHDRYEKLLTIGAISREEHEQTESKLAMAEASFEEAKKRYDRAVKVADINPISRNEFEAAAVKRQTAESDLEAVRQRLILFGMTPQRLNSLRSPSQITSESAVAAPISGTITKRDANAGEVIEANKELYRITDLSTVWVVAQVYEKDLSQIRTGTGATVTTDGFPGRVFRGHVTYIDPNISSDTRTAQVRVELDNPGQVLKLGMYVNAAFGSSGMAERTLPIVPTAAVQSMNDRKVVFVSTGKPNVFTVKQVRLGAENNGHFTVLEGLNVGDRVVTEGSFLLRAELLKQEPSRH